MKVICARNPNHRLVVDGDIKVESDGTLDFSWVYCGECSNEDGEPNPNVEGATAPDGSYAGDDLTIDLSPTPLEMFETLLDRSCGVSIRVGPAHDPSGVTCLKDHEFHEDDRYNDMHVGRSPFGDDYVVWQGGGAIQGDPLPIMNRQWGVEFDEKAYEDMVKEKVFK